MEDLLIFNEKKKERWENKTPDQVKVDNERLLALYSETVELDIDDCLKKIVFQEVANMVTHNNEYGPKAYQVFVSLMKLKGDWTTRKEITYNFFSFFDDYLSCEYKNKIFKYIFNGCFEEKNEKNSPSIEDYIKECNRVIKIGEIIEDSFIRDIGFENLIFLHFYYEEYTKALGYATQMIDNREEYVKLCFSRIIENEKIKHFKKDW